nr:immunoglobulin heavy chain junction region [Macaca mulatta]MOV47557.1 immunoglobulin heavy chain junction region [Macaca mulatta]MOV47630.1 immunoglobulin heavy chain junction region [Macaca mulatta]
CARVRGSIYNWNDFFDYW